MQHHEEVLALRIPQQLAARLAEHKRRTLIPTSAFVRFAIESALGMQFRDAETAPAPTFPALVAQDSDVKNA